MTKSELISKIAAGAKVSKAIVDAVLAELEQAAIAALAAGDDVPLPGLGKLATVKRPARTGRNPKTGEEIKIAARMSPKFSPAKALKDALNPAPKAKAKK